MILVASTSMASFSEPRLKEGDERVPIPMTNNHQPKESRQIDRKMESGKYGMIMEILFQSKPP